MNTWHAAFWCALAERDVEVEFVTGLQNPSGVRSCSAFDPQTAVSCHRRCLDPAFRRQWPSALPVHTRADDLL